VILLVAITALASYSGSIDRFAQVSPHPFWIPVLLIAAQYGTSEALLTVVLSTLILLVGNLPASLVGEDFYSYWWRVTSLPLQWVCAAVIIGEISGRHRRARIQAEQELASSREREDLLVVALGNVETAKQLSDRALAGLTSSPAQIFNILRSIDSRNLDHAMNQFLELIHVVLSPKKFSFFIMGTKGLELVSAQKWQSPNEFESCFDLGSALYRRIVEDRGIVNVTDAGHGSVLGSQGVLAVPIIENTQSAVIGMLKIEEIDWTKLTVANISAFRLMSEWFGNVYGTALHIRALEFAHHTAQVASSEHLRRPVTQPKAAATKSGARKKTRATATAPKYAQL